MQFSKIRKIRNRTLPSLRVLTKFTTILSAIFLIFAITTVNAEEKESGEKKEGSEKEGSEKPSETKEGGGNPSSNSDRDFAKRKTNSSFYFLPLMQKVTKKSSRFDAPRLSLNL